MQDKCLHKTTLNAITSYLSALTENGGRYRLIIKKWSDKRSINQNSLSHMWYEDITWQINNKLGKEAVTPESVKKDLKEMFLGYEEKEHTNVITGKTTYTHTLVKTSELDRESMHFYLQQVETWAYQNNLTLRIPNNSEYMKIKREQLK